MYSITYLITTILIHFIEVSVRIKKEKVTSPDGLSQEDNYIIDDVELKIEGVEEEEEMSQDEEGQLSQDSQEPLEEVTLKDEVRPTYG